MSDYLGNLLTRTVAPGSGVQPRLLALFEPPPLTRQFPEAPDAKPAALLDTHDVAVPGPQVALANQTHTPKLSFERRMEPDIARGADETETLVNEHPRVRGSTARPAVLKANPMPAAESQQMPGAMRVTSSVTMDSHARQLVADEKTKTILHAAPNGTAPINPIPSLHVPPLNLPPMGDGPRTVDEIEDPARLMQENSEGNPVLRAVSSVKPGLHQAAGPVFPPAARLAHDAIRSAAPVPAPTINITIGRVEVKAVSPPARPAAKTTRRPIMSLDDYLRQRSGGRS
jgi:hypothetical protein